MHNTSCSINTLSTSLGSTCTKLEDRIKYGSIAWIPLRTSPDFVPHTAFDPGRKTERQNSSMLVCTYVQTVLCRSLSSSLVVSTHTHILSHAHHYIQALWVRFDHVPKARRPLAPFVLLTLFLVQHTGRNRRRDVGAVDAAEPQVLAWCICFRPRLHWCSGHCHLERGRKELTNADASDK